MVHGKAMDKGDMSLELKYQRECAIKLLPSKL
jgi:hypothetical protein